MWHVDPTHDTLITTGNGGNEPTTAEVTLFYNGGTGKYRIEKMLMPGQQLWLDLAHLAHDQVPDSDGRTLPPDTTMGSYELRDLDHATVGELYEGKLVIDKTFGHAAYGCGSCCGYDAIVLDPDPFAGPTDTDSDDYIYATDACIGDQVDVTGSGYGWDTADAKIATLPTRTLHTVAVGSTTGNASVQLQFDHPPSCPLTTFSPGQSVAVMSCDDQVPTSETTAYEGLTYLTEGSFVMTLNPSASCNFDGHNVQETNYATGTDTCYWPGANIANPPSVAGSTWLVGSGTGISTDQYGIDSIGFPSTGVSYIQENAEEHDVDFPCVVTFYQQMSFEIDADTYQGMQKTSTRKR